MTSYPDAKKETTPRNKQDVPKSALPLYDRDCNLCGAPLHFAISSSGAGKRVALDLRATVFAIVYEKAQAQTSTVVVRTEMAYVNHFYTCPETAPNLKTHQKIEEIKK